MEEIVGYELSKQESKPTTLQQNDGMDNIANDEVNKVQNPASDNLTEVPAELQAEPQATPQLPDSFLPSNPYQCPLSHSCFAQNYATPCRYLNCYSNMQKIPDIMATLMNFMKWQELSVRRISDHTKKSRHR